MLKWYFFLEQVILEVENKVDHCGTFTIKFNNYLIVVIICHWFRFFKIFILFNFDMVQTSLRQTAQE